MSKLRHSFALGASVLVLATAATPAFAQEAALIEANNRMQQLEWEAEAARREGQAHQHGVGRRRTGTHGIAQQPQHNNDAGKAGHHQQAEDRAGEGGQNGVGAAGGSWCGVGHEQARCTALSRPQAHHAGFLRAAGAGGWGDSRVRAY